MTRREFTGTNPGAILAASIVDPAGRATGRVGPATVTQKSISDPVGHRMMLASHHGAR
jgi:hypothetical protein